MATTRFINPSSGSLMRKAYLRAGRKFSVNLYVGPLHPDEQPILIKASDWCTSVDEAMRTAMTFTNTFYPPEVTCDRTVSLIPVVMGY